MPWFIRIEGQCLRTQVDAQATQLREQLDRVEAQQRSMTESVVTLKSFALDKSAPGDTDPGEEVNTSRQFFNSLVKEVGERLGGRVWMVDDTGCIIGDAPGVPTVQSLNDASLPMAVPLRGLLAIDVPTRRLGKRPGILLHKPWPLAALLLVSTLALLRSLNLHLSRLNEELPSQLKTEQGAHLPPLMKGIGEQVGGIARAASAIAEENERLLRVPEANGNLLSMLSESTTGVFAVKSRNLASRCARSSKELRALVDDAMMQAQSGGPSVTQNTAC
ncbi:methyl-accepting chemotaxis protein [Enterobacter bugandensis]|uniref:methyl-accepting chemotaxis protein n=1 Tax=Enterobacter bugandensis TaxID=881260 RepID=UPI0021D110F4|nr:methyl-accepting chemotaxis protein [Enterobacter bugandensis]